MRRKVNITELCITTTIINTRFYQLFRIDRKGGKTPITIPFRGSSYSCYLPNRVQQHDRFEFHRVRCRPGTSIPTDGEPLTIICSACCGDGKVMSSTTTDGITLTQEIGCENCDGRGMTTNRITTYASA